MNYYTRLIIMLVASMAISMLLTRFFGLFVGLAMSFAVFILISIYMRKRAMGNPAGLFGTKLNYVCIACGHKFRGGSCPRCGSKMKKAEF